MSNVVHGRCAWSDGNNRRTIEKYRVDRLPFNGEEHNEPDGNEAESVGCEEKALADSGRVDPTYAVSAGPQWQTVLEPVEQNVRQQDEAVGQRDGWQIETWGQATHPGRPSKYTERQRVAQQSCQTASYSTTWCDDSCFTVFILRPIYFSYLLLQCLECYNCP